MNKWIQVFAFRIKSDSFRRYSRLYRSTSFLSRSPWRETFEKFDNIRETDLSLYARNFSKFPPKERWKESEKEGRGHRVPRRKFESSRNSRPEEWLSSCETCSAYYLVWVAIPSRDRPMADEKFSRPLHAPLPSPPPPRNFIRSAFPVVPNPRILTFHEYYTNKGSLRHTIFIQIRWFSFEFEGICWKNDSYTTIFLLIFFNARRKLRFNRTTKVRELSDWWYSLWADSKATTFISFSTLHESLNVTKERMKNIQSNFKPRADS